MEDKRPSEYFNALADSGAFPNEHPFALLTALKDVPQSPVHHPEGNVWNHTMLVVDNAAGRKDLSRDARALMWAALLHDLGKIPTTKLRKGKITAYEHDVEGEKLARDFLKECTGDEAFIKNVCALVRWHMQLLYVTRHLPYCDLMRMTSEADKDEVALLAFCDRLGRGQLTQQAIDEEIKNIDYFLQKCRRYDKTALNNTRS